MNTVKDAVIAAFAPVCIWRGQIETRVTRRFVEDIDGAVVEQTSKHFVWRLYWPIEDIELVYELKEQGAFPF